MRVFFDTEFIENGKTIDLISIGMVREDGDTYYAEPLECDLSKASPWVVKNVLPQLRPTHRKPRKLIASEIVDFVGEEPKFWAFFSAYDWVALCQLFGTMMHLPKGWPMWCRDLKQELARQGIVDLPAQTTVEHDALADALYTKELFDLVMRD